MNELYHHGIDGQKWGVRNGPPYPLDSEGKTKVRAQRDGKNTVRKSGGLIDDISDAFGVKDIADAFGVKDIADAFGISKITGEIDNIFGIRDMAKKIGAEETVSLAYLLPENVKENKINDFLHEIEQKEKSGSKVTMVTMDFGEDFVDRLRDLPLEIDPKTGMYNYTLAFDLINSEGKARGQKKRKTRI